MVLKGHIYVTQCEDFILPEKNKIFKYFLCIANSSQKMRFRSVIVSYVSQKILTASSWFRILKFELILVALCKQGLYFWNQPHMNITELARRLKVPTTELKERLPQLGFDIGMRAIKVPDKQANQIIEAWKKEEKRRQLEEKVKAAKEQQAPKQTDTEGREVILLPPVITVRDLAAKFGMPIPALIAELMRHGVMAAISDKVDYEIAAIVAEGLGKTTEQGENISAEQEQTEALHQAILQSKTNHGGAVVTRPPVVVVMGHVDHGKTKLLDAIRATDVVDDESGGITQHIGAYQVEKNNRSITFIDTPGHEAFSHMRSRGAVVADVAILVVAADDGVQPQTVEAIKMIQDAQLPMVVAINKIDKPEANPDVVKQGLAELNVMVEGWGGDVPFVAVSALKGTNIDELLEVVLLVADVHKEKLQARVDGSASGVIVESHVDTGAGPVATVLVHAGTLVVGDSFQVGDVFGKIRALKSYVGESIKEAGPSTPAQIIGLPDVPAVGLLLTSQVDLKKLRRTVGKRKHKSGDMAGASVKEQSDEGDHPVYNVIVKADVAGSLEAILHSLHDIDTKEVRVSVVGKGLGSITEVDVVRAAESHAKIFAFHTEVSRQARQLAQDKEVVIEQYEVIYGLLDTVKKDVEALLLPETVRHELGKLEVLKLFGKREKANIIGCKVISGKAVENSKCILYRGDRVLGEGSVSEIRIGPDKRSEVNKGDECGLKVSGIADVQEEDVLEIFTEETKKRTLAD